MEDAKSLKEELNSRKKWMFTTVLLAICLVVSFPKILLVVLFTILTMSIPAILVHGFKEGVNCTLRYTRMYLWDFTFYNNYKRIKEIKEKILN